MKTVKINIRGPWTVEALGTTWTYGWYDFAAGTLVAFLVAVYAIVVST